MQKLSVLKRLGLGAGAVALCLPQLATAQDVSAKIDYDTALRCAAVNTLISGVIGGAGQDQSPSAQDKKMVEHFDAMVQLWMNHAASIEGQDKALADYLQRANALVEKAGQTQDEAEMESLVGHDMAMCGELEEQLLLAEEK